MGTISIRTFTGKFLEPQRGVTGNATLIAAEHYSIGINQTFHWILHSDGSVSLQSAYGKYLSYLPTGALAFVEPEDAVAGGKFWIKNTSRWETLAGQVPDKQRCCALCHQTLR